MNSPTYAQPSLKSVRTTCMFRLETAGRYVDRRPFIPFHRKRQKNKSPLFLCLKKKIHPCCQRERLCLFQCHRYMCKQRHFLHWHKDINNFPNPSCCVEKTILPSPAHTHLAFPFAVAEMKLCLPQYPRRCSGALPEALAVGCRVYKHCFLIALSVFPSFSRQRMHIKSIGITNTVIMLVFFVRCLKHLRNGQGKDTFLFSLRRGRGKNLVRSQAR